jgi:phosphoribosylanthranilate isomerase
MNEATTVHGDADDGPAARAAPARVSTRTPARTRIKICGLRTLADAEVAAQAGADAIGLVFYDKSPRFLTLQQAERLARALPPFVTPVGLFVNAPASFIEEAVHAIPNLLLQFHGDETPAQCAAPGRAYLRAARIVPGFDLVKFADTYPDALALLLDAHVDGYGGGGKVFDWSLVRADDVGSPLVLSGGLHAGNVTDGIRQLRPWAVDVSSGVESSRGVKDPAAIRRFCKAVRDADAQLADIVPSD